MKVPPGIVAVLLAPLLPWLSWYTTGVHWGAILSTPLLFYCMGAFLALSIWIAKQDLWLGVLCGWLSLNILWHPKADTFEVAQLVTLGSVGIVFIQRLTESQRQWAVRLLLLGGVSQAAVAYYQWTGTDLLWGQPQAGVIGGIGNPDYLATYLAPIAVMGPVAVALLLGMVIVLTKSAIGIVATGTGLAIRYRAYRLLWAGVSLLGISYVMMTKPLWSHSLMIRLHVWTLALQTSSWSEWLIGHGPGAWQNQIPDLQIRLGVWPSQTLDRAHSEPIQLLYEGGLIALAFVLAWFWTHREMWTNGWAGPVAALALVNCWMFGLHLGTTALVALVILGLATPVGATATA